MGIEELIAAEALAAEANRDAPVKPGSVISRGHGRTRTLQVRLNEEELNAVNELAAKRGLPASTLARDLLMNQVTAHEATPQAMIARLRSDLEALASTVA